MAKTSKSIIVSEEKIVNKIYLIRDKKVMLDFDLAEMYAVETKQLKRQVRRNSERFPEDFMFVLTVKEYQSLRSQIGILKEVNIANIHQWLLQNRVWPCSQVC